MNSDDLARALCPDHPLQGRLAVARLTPEKRRAYERLIQVADALHRTLIDAGYEPDHMASSIEATVKNLWEARAALRDGAAG